MFKDKRMSLLIVKDLKIYFSGKSWIFRTGHTDKAVDGVSFQIEEGKNVGLVGESGSGKTTIARSIIGLQKITSGSIWFMNHDMSVNLNGQRKQLLSKMRMIFQNPEAALNPHMRIHNILDEACLIRTGIKSVNERRKIIKDIIDRVHLSQSLLDVYPKNLSGGQKRRVMIARALFGTPVLIIGDEPLSSLDFVIQEQIIDLFEELQTNYGFTLLLISHSLDIIRRLCHDIIVIYKGKAVEKVPAKKLSLSVEHHEYTRLLLKASRLENLKTVLPRKQDIKNNNGCVFLTECSKYKRLNSPEICRTAHPSLVSVNERHLIACHFPREV